jgi:thioredoxin reductase
VEKKTIIIGGGIAGLSCALRLQEVNEDFLIITDNLGGRLKYSVKKINNGAYFVMKSYKNAGNLISRGRHTRRHYKRTS